MSMNQTVPAMEENNQTEVERFYVVTEIFGPTIQGEGSEAGKQSIFIRFGGCDYRCSMCDSMHAVDPNLLHIYGSKFTTSTIVSKVIALSVLSNCKHVIFSGGNPCIWDLTYLVDELHSLGFTIAVETQGTIYQEWLQKVNHITISPKSPGMGIDLDFKVFEDFLAKLYPEDDDAQENPFANRWPLYPSNAPKLCVKVVIFDQNDLEFALLIENTVRLFIHKAYIDVFEPLYLSLGNAQPPQMLKAIDPITQNEQVLFDDSTSNDLVQNLTKSYRILAEDILQDSRLNAWRFLPQIHVLVWSNESKH